MACSLPDLNPVEQVWMVTKLKLKKFSDMKELEDYVFGLWKEIPKDTILSYISMVKDKPKFVAEIMETGMQIK